MEITLTTGTSCQKIKFFRKRKVCDISVMQSLHDVVTFMSRMYIVLSYDDDLNAVFEETATVIQWYSLGLFLDVNPNELDRINTDYRFSHEGLVQMLGVWLKSGRANWFSLVHALMKMGQSNLATRIARKKGVYNSSNLIQLAKQQLILPSRLSLTLMILFHRHSCG